MVLPEGIRKFNRELARTGSPPKAEKKGAIEKRPLLFAATLPQLVVTNRPRRLAHWTTDWPPDESGYVQRCPESVYHPFRQPRVTA